MESKTCQQCDRTFEKLSTRSIGQWQRAKFCSLACAQENKNGKKFSDTHKRHLSEGRMGKANPFYGHRHTENYKQMMSRLLTGRVFSPESIVRMSAIRKGRFTGQENPFFGKHHTAETKTLILQNRRYLKPNKPEKQLIALMQERGLPYKYVGDGQFILGGKCPDFLNINGKKQVIELFGAYWHDVLEVAERTEHFRQYGFETLVIWEDELKDMTKITKKITKFSKMKATSI